jgi:hypothetical protein
MAAANERRLAAIGTDAPRANDLAGFVACLTFLAAIHTATYAHEFVVIHCFASYALGTRNCRVMANTFVTL